MNENTILLTKDNINKIKYDDVIAITIAEGGAMGEPNAFHSVLNDLTHYYVNLGEADFDRKDFFEAFPLMKTFRCFCAHVDRLEDGWKWYNMGFGNYLLVRKEYSNKVEEHIKNNFKDNWEHGELYQKWFDMLKDIIK